MKIHRCTDGASRVFTRIEYFFDVESMAVYWLRDVSPHHADKAACDEALRRARHDTQRQVMTCVKRTLKTDGEELPHYRIGDENLSDLCAEIAEIFRTRFFT